MTNFRNIVVDIKKTSPANEPEPLFPHVNEIPLLYSYIPSCGSFSIFTHMSKIIINKRSFQTKRISLEYTFSWYQSSEACPQCSKQKVFLVPYQLPNFARLPAPSAHVRLKLLAIVFIVTYQLRKSCTSSCIFCSCKARTSRNDLSCHLPVAQIFHVFLHLLLM